MTDPIAAWPPRQMWSTPATDRRLNSEMEVSQRELSREFRAEMTLGAFTDPSAKFSSTQLRQPGWSLLRS